MATFQAKFVPDNQLNATFHTDDAFATEFADYLGGGGIYELPPATKETLGGIIVGSDLQITKDGVLSVVKATSVEKDNTRPITAAAVYTTVGNITALLESI